MRAEAVDGTGDPRARQVSEKCRDMRTGTYGLVASTCFVVRLRARRTGILLTSGNAARVRARCEFVEAPRWTRWRRGRGEPSHAPACMPTKDITRARSSPRGRCPAPCGSRAARRQAPDGPKGGPVMPQVSEFSAGCAAGESAEVSFWLNYTLLVV